MPSVLSTGIEQGKDNGASVGFKSIGESEDDGDECPVKGMTQDPLFGPITSKKTKKRSESTTSRNRNHATLPELDLTESQTLRVKYRMQNGMTSVGTFAATFAPLTVPVSGNTPPFQIVLHPIDPNLPTVIPQPALMGPSIMSHVRPLMPSREMPICVSLPAAVVHPPVVHHPTPSPLITGPAPNPTVSAVPARTAVMQGASQKPDSNNKVWTGMCLK